MDHPTGCRRGRDALLVLITALTLPSAALAQSINLAPSAPGEWRVGLTPYLFLPVTTTGTATIADAEADVDLDLSDIFGAMRFAGSARAEVWRGDLGLIVDGYYANLSAGTTLSFPDAGVSTARVDLTLVQGWVTAMGAYRALQGSYGDAGRRYGIDAAIGFRWNSLRQEVEAAVDIDQGEDLQATLGGRETWFEPVIGIRGGVEVSESWTLGARAELGGFGANGSDLQWNVLAGADYAPWETVSLKIGWQVYGIDFETERSDGTFGYNVVQTGPYLGATFRF
ncbi:MAG: hypothetical protein AAF675_08670 [Pseudomonadota bacterium]